MGTLRSTTDQRGTTVNDVLLGQGIRLDADRRPLPTDEQGQVVGTPAWFAWDDSAFPNGEIQADGSIVVDEVDL